MNDFSEGFDDFGRYFPVGDKFTDKLRNVLLIMEKIRNLTPVFLASRDGRR